MDNSQIGSIQEVLKDCILTLGDHSFFDNLMPMVSGSFDIIIGIDWLSLNPVKILCFEKALHLPLSSDKFLIVYGDKASIYLRIISCMKARKYLKKEYYALLFHIFNSKDNMKRIEEVPQVCDYLDVFPEDLPGLPQHVKLNFRLIKSQELPE